MYDCERRRWEGFVGLAFKGFVSFQGRNISGGFQGSFLAWRFDLVKRVCLVLN